MVNEVKRTFEMRPPSSVAEPRATLANSPRLVEWRLFALVLLLLTEALVFGIVFDSDNLRHLPAGWWSVLQPAYALTLRIASVTAAAGLLLGGHRIFQILSRERHAIATHGAWPAMLLHVSCVLMLFAVSGQLFGVISTQTQHPGPWVIAWIAGVVACGISWLTAALPLRVLGLVLRECGRILTLGFGVGLLAWAVGQYTQGLWKPLRISTLHAAYLLLRAADAKAFVDAPHFVIGVRSFAVEISSQCSGFEGIGLGWVFLGAYCWFFRSRLRFPQALLLWPLLTAASWLGNVLRIAVLVLIGAHGLSTIALGSFHSYAGLLLFIALALGTVYLADHSAFFTHRTATVATAAQQRNPTAPWLLPLLVMLATGLLTDTFHRPGLDPLYGVRVFAAGAVLWCYRDQYRQLSFRFSWSWVLIGTGVFALCLALAERSPRPAALPFVPKTWAGIGWLGVRSFGYVFIVPIVEELAFRGYLARRLMASDFEAVKLQDLSGFAIIGSAILFGAVHADFFAGCLAGIGYALAAKFRGRVTDSIAAHSLTNALVTICVVWTHRWALWT